MTESTPAPLGNFTVFGVIAEAWHLTKGAKWPILAPFLAGMLFILAIAGIFLIKIHLLSLLLTGMMIVLLVRFISITIPLNSIKSSRLFRLAPFVIAIIFALLALYTNVTSALIYLAGLFLVLGFFYVIFGFLAGIIKISIERARGHEISRKMGFNSFPRALPLALTFLVNVIILSPPQLITFYFFGFQDINIGMALITFIYSVEVGALLYLCLPLTVEKTNSPFTATLASLKASKDYWFKLMGIFIILYVAPYVVFLLSMAALFLSTLLISAVPSFSLHFVLYTNILTIAFVFLMFIPFIWLIPLMFLIQGVVYHKLVD